MRNIDYSQYFGKVDLVAGDIHCQSFSIAGKREGLDNKNGGGLFFTFFKIIEDISPYMFLVENVEGSKNINSGNTLKHIINKFESLELKMQMEKKHLFFNSATMCIFFEKKSVKRK